MDILMPQLGETVTEGLVATWHKREGDNVSTDEALLDIETDKVATEIRAPVDGILVKIAVAEGQTVAVGTVLAVIDAGDNGNKVQPPGDGGTVIKSLATPTGDESVATASIEPVSASRGIANARVDRLSPLVRRLLQELEIDASQITGTGRDGRITREDVEAVAARMRDLDGRPAARECDERVPFTRLRRLTAEHMTRSKATSPHVLQAVEADFVRVVEVRNRIGAAWEATRGYSLTYLPFVAYAVCKAIEAFPRVNASVENDTLVIHRAVNLAFAIDLGEEGLVAPVVRNAQTLAVAELAEAIRGLVIKARSGQLRADDMNGGTYTISNSGSYGTLITAPIINQPQVAILSTDKVRKRVIVIESQAGDSMAIRPIGILAQSFDHRAIDGAYSAAFLKQLADIIESSDWANMIRA